MRLWRVVLPAALLALILGLGPAAWGAEIPQATCLDCHEGEGMQYAVIQSTPFIEVPTDQTQQFSVTVANPWLHDITSSLVTLNLSQAPGLSFEKASDLDKNETVQVSLDSSTNVSFPVKRGATGLRAKMVQPPDESGQGFNDVDSKLYLPTNGSISATSDGVDTGDPAGLKLPERQPSQANTVEQIVVNDDRLATTGNWTFSLERASGDATQQIGAEIDVWYNATDTQSQRITETIVPDEAANSTFPIRGLAQSNVTVTYTVEVTDYYEHPQGVQSQDEGNATLEGERSFTVGNERVLGQAAPAVPDQGDINWKLNARIWGEATGFIGLFMIPLSLVLGGAFGRKNVLWMNKVTRSARLRVLWHNALSFALLAISTLHLALFLYEAVYDWSVGFVWGGLALLALMGLGITGGLQQRMARSIGYAKWRLLHVALATTFVTATLAHVLVDGAHFDFLRAWLGLS